MRRSFSPLILGVLLCLAPAAASAAPSAAFDWSMPDRYGLDADNDGLIDEMTASDQISPSGWTVRFDACASSGGIVEYRWDIDGIVIPKPDCKMNVSFAEEGPHQVILTVEDAAGATANVSQRVVVQDYLIVGVGDSLASGEANPTVPADFSDLLNIGQPLWQDRQCHRSEISWQAQAALKLEQDDPHTSVTFVHLACSGATVDVGLLGPYNGIEPAAGSEVKEPQIWQASQLVGGREVDALLLSIGANDLNFGDVVTSCMAGVHCHDHENFINQDSLALAAWEALCFPLALFGLDDECVDFLMVDPVSAQSIYDGNIPLLPGFYDDLADEIELRFPEFPQDRIYVAGYPQLTRDQDGDLCVNDPIGFEVEETEWADTVVTPGLNGTIESSSESHGWNYIEGVPEAFKLHGYCSSQSWARRIEDSLVTQLNHNGAVHPIRVGHEKYRDMAFAELVQDVYVGGNLAIPRDPLAPPVAVAGGPYLFDEGGSVQAQNGSSDPAGDPLTHHWSAGSASVSFSDVNAAEPTISAIDDTDGFISLTVSDGVLSDSDTAKVTVSNVAPQVDLTSSPATGNEGILYFIGGSFHDPGLLDTHSGSIVWGDGGFSPIVNASSENNNIGGFHLYPDDASFDISVTIVDDDGGIGFATHSVAIVNLPPIDLAFEVLSAAPEGSSSQTSVSFGDYGIQDTHTGSVAWGDGGVSGPVATTSPYAGAHVYGDDGMFPILVSITDDDGGVSTLTGALTVTNVAPSAGVGSVSGVEGSPSDLTLAFSDPGTLDTHSASIDWGDGSALESVGQLVSPLSAAHVYADNGSYTAAVTISDDDGGSVQADVPVAVSNADPEVSASAAAGVEGGPVSVPVSFSDAGILDTHTASVDWGDGSGEALGAVTSPFAPVHVYLDDGSYAVDVTVGDDDGGVGAASASVTVANAAPLVGEITGLEDPIQVDTAATASASFSDAGPLDIHTGSFDWGDGTSSPATVVENGGSGMASGSHVYTAPGVYTVTLSVTDDDGASSESIYQFAVVYDPSGGFVTGAGTIGSPAGALVADPGLTGTAHFGFVAKYQKGTSTVPIGSTHFRFAVAGLEFQSESYQWLVVAGKTAKHKGTGTLNGEAGYGFMISASDGNAKNNPDVDRFRIKIWDAVTEAVVYDNQLGDADDGDATTAISGGNIVVHK